MLHVVDLHIRTGFFLLDLPSFILINFHITFCLCLNKVCYLT